MAKFTQSYIEKYIKKGVFSPVANIVVSEIVKEILALAKKEIKKPVSSLVVLDVGSGLGEYAFELEKHVKKVVGVEPYDVLYNMSLKGKKIKKDQSKRFSEESFRSRVSGESSVKASRCAANDLPSHLYRQAAQSQ